MRKYLYAAPLAAAALVLATPAALANTTTTRTASHVLTIKRLHGSAVKANAVLKASLKTGTTATITLAGHKMTCKKASFALTVLTNPRAKGKATGSVTSEKISRCKINVAGITVTSIVAGNLPYNATISDAKGDPVKVSETSGEAPVEFTATVMFAGNPIVCTYQAAGSTGHAANTHHTVTFTKQAFNLAPASNGFCLAGPSKLSVTFGPIVDSSVSGSPTVYVN
jgi:hypothetical protein